MSWIPLVFGSIGAFAGGYLSDRLSKGRKTSVIKVRLIVVISCLFISAPCQIGTLLLPYPWTWISHIFAYLFGEMWIGVCIALVIDLVPDDLTTSSVAVYFFIIQASHSISLIHFTFLFKVYTKFSMIILNFFFFCY